MNTSRIDELTGPVWLRPARQKEAELLHGMLQKHFFWYSPGLKDGKLRSIIGEERAQKGDIPHGYFAPFTLEDMEMSIANGLTYVVDYASLPVAQGTLAPRGNGVYEIARVYTEPPMRGHGFMELVLERLEERAREVGAQEIRAVSQGKALDLFIANGYSIDPIPADRADKICNGCRIKEICPETGLVKYLAAAQASAQAYSTAAL